jgi:hypothetical protein
VFFVSSIIQYLPDGPEPFQDAYRRIIQACRSEGSENITRVFHVYDGGFPSEIIAQTMKMVI